MSNIYQDKINDEIEIDLKRIYKSLKKGIKWLIFVPIVFGLITIIYLGFIADPVYTSESKLLLVGKESSQSYLKGLASQFGFSIPSSSDGVEYLSSENLPVILKSRTLTQAILFSEFKSKKFKIPMKYFSILFDSTDVMKRDSSLLIDSGSKYIAEKVISIQQIKNTNIFHIFANSPEPSLSSQIAERTIYELENLQAAFTHNERVNEKDFVASRLREVEYDLFNAESRLKTFREQNLQINLSPSLLLEQERRLRDIEIQTQLYISFKQQLEQVKIEENKHNTFLKIIDKPNIPVKPSKPRKKLVFLVVIFIGVIIGSAISITKYY